MPPQQATGELTDLFKRHIQKSTILNRVTAAAISLLRPFFCFFLEETFIADYCAVIYALS
jgi:hypothetical protein